MDEYESLSHTKWQCKYHVVFIPKCRRKTLYGKLRMHLGEIFHQLAKQKECRIEEGHLMSDHVHMRIAIPPKYAVSQIIGYIKGKSAIHVARGIRGAKAEFRGATLLGSRVFRIHSGARRGDNPGVHTKPGARGSATGPDEIAGLNGHR